MGRRISLFHHIRTTTSGWPTLNRNLAAPSLSALLPVLPIYFASACLVPFLPPPFPPLQCRPLARADPQLRPIDWQASGAANTASTWRRGSSGAPALPPPAATICVKREDSILIWTFPPPKRKCPQLDCSSSPPSVIHATSGSSLETSVPLGRLGTTTATPTLWTSTSSSSSDAGDIQRLPRAPFNARFLDDPRGGGGGGGEGQITGRTLAPIVRGQGVIFLLTYLPSRLACAGHLVVVEM